jgi:hypothetical protein
MGSNYRPLICLLWFIGSSSGLFLASLLSIVPFFFEYYQCRRVTWCLFVAVLVLPDFAVASIAASIVSLVLILLFFLIRSLLLPYLILPLGFISYRIRYFIRALSCSLLIMSCKLVLLCFLFPSSNPHLLFEYRIILLIFCLYSYCSFNLSTSLFFPIFCTLFSLLLIYTVSPIFLSYLFSCLFLSY